MSGGVASPTIVTWNIESRVAAAVFGMEGEAKGKVTAVRVHNSGVRINILLTTVKPLGSDEIELLVLPLEAEKTRIFSVGYRVVDGIRHLNLLLGDDEAQCQKQ